MTSYHETDNYATTTQHGVLHPSSSYNYDGDAIQHQSLFVPTTKIYEPQQDVEEADDMIGPPPTLQVYAPDYNMENDYGRTMITDPYSYDHYQHQPQYGSQYLEVNSMNTSSPDHGSTIIGFSNNIDPVVIGDDDDEIDDDDDEISTHEVLYRIECVVAMIVEALDNLIVPEMIQYTTVTADTNDDDNVNNAYFCDSNGSRVLLEQQRMDLSSSITSEIDQHLRSNNYVNSTTISATMNTIMKKPFTLQQSRSFTSMVLVLAYCHSLLQSNTTSTNNIGHRRIRTTTTREVYYYYITHFRNQRECDATIWDICTLLQVPRHTLGLQASSRGWFCGDIQLLDNNINKTTTVQWDGRTYRGEQGCPISSDWLLPSKKRSFQLNTTTTATCIVIVEKEGIYQRLVQDGVWYQHQCILITGKGFPDLATRACVYTLHHQLQLPVYGLADCDPFGVAVLYCYSFGGGGGNGTAGIGETTTINNPYSVGNRRKKGGDGGDRYAVPLRWLGLRPSQIHLLSQPTTFCDVSVPALPTSVYQELTDIDRKRLIDHFWNELHPFVRHQHPGRVQELRNMISMKVELEALYWLGMSFCSVFVGFLLDRARQQQQQQEQCNNIDYETDSTSIEWSWMDSI